MKRLRRDATIPALPTEVWLLVESHINSPEYTDLRGFLCWHSLVSYHWERYRQWPCEKTEKCLVQKITHLEKYELGSPHGSVYCNWAQLTQFRLVMQICEIVVLKLSTVNKVLVSFAREKTCVAPDDCKQFLCKLDAFDRFIPMKNGANDYGLWLLGQVRAWIRTRYGWYLGIAFDEAGNKEILAYPWAAKQHDPKLGELALFVSVRCVDSGK